MNEPDTGERLPPHSDEAEIGILGCIMLDPIASIEKCFEALKAGPQVFFDLRHRTIYQEILELHDDNCPVEIILLQQRLKDRKLLEQIGGISYLNALQDGVPSAAHLAYYLDIVVEKWTLRNLVSACQKAIDRIYQSDVEIDSIVGEVERKVIAMESSATKPTLDGTLAGARMVNDLERRFALDGKLSGLDTGLRQLNRLTEGLQYGEQCIIGARPSQGKTALGLSIMAHNVFKNSVPSLFVSLEMSIEALMRRLCAMQTRVPLSTVKSGKYSQADFEKFTTFQALMRRSPIYFMDGVDGCGIREIATRINRLVLKHGIKLVVIDYLQQIKPSEKQEKRTYEVAEVSRRLKALAHDNNVAMITLAQLNRENVKAGGKNDKGRAPRLSDLADSGQIERDADVVGLIHREENKAALIIAKQRDGETGIVPLYFNAPFAQFESLEDYEPTE